jgi:conjugative transfer pilus assembly protein TraH
MNTDLSASPTFKAGKPPSQRNRRIRSVVSSLQGAGAALALSVAGSATSADVAGDLQNFWENSGGGVNVTRPLTYEGQRAGFVSLGSVQVRTRTRNTQMANIQLPSVRAGCGGIDLFGGSFSFLSREELIQLMEVIMQNAAGFAFELALESMSPAVQETVSKLRDLAQQVNAMNINSCEAGQALASTLWPKIDGASQHVCATIGAYQGLFADRAAGKHDCGTGGRQNDTLARANDELIEQVPVDINYAWEAIRKNPFLSSDENLAEFFMTLTGTIITTAGANDNEGPRHNPVPPRAASEDMVRALVEGGTAQVLRCDDDDCLAPTLLPMTITTANSLYQRVSDTIGGIKDALEDGDETLSDEAVALLGMTSVPVLDMLVTGMSYQHVFVESEIQAMAEVVAVDLAMVYIDQALQEMNATAGRLSTFGDITFEFQDQIAETQNNFAALRALAAERYSQAVRTLERLSLAKNELAAYSSSRFAAMLAGQ